MTTPGFALFDTAIGRCGIAWSDHGVAAVQLPARDDAELRQRLGDRIPGAEEATPPAVVRRAIEAIVGLLDGERRDLAGITLDTRGVAPFARAVYEVARTIPPGATASYGEIAAAAGHPGAARAVGQALGRNPFAIVVPCHRVVGAGGRLGGFSADGGVRTKRRMLAIEEAATGGAPGRPAISPGP